MKLSIEALFFTFVFSFAMGECCSAQQANCTYRLYFKGGSTISGELLRYDDTVQLRLPNGLDLMFPKHAIKKVVDLCPKMMVEQLYRFREKGWYNHATIGFMTQRRASRFDNGLITGLGINYSIGYQINRFTGFGLAIGREVLERNDNQPIFYPIFAEYRGYLFPKKITPFWRVSAGYSVASSLGDENTTWNTLTYDKGGFGTSAYFGYRFGGRKSGNLTLELGWQSQNFGYDYQYLDWQGEISEEGTVDLRHYRIGLRFGVQF